MKEQYLESIHLIERLHRQFLEVVKGELDRLDIQDVNNVQAVILYNIGRDELTVGELTNRGYYLGSNVSYNVRKMVENDYLVQERSTHDRRSVRVRLSNKGLELHEVLDGMFTAQAERLVRDITSEEDLDTANALLRRLERFWIAAMNFPIRAASAEEETRQFPGH